MSLNYPELPKIELPDLHRRNISLPIHNAIDKLIYESIADIQVTRQGRCIVIKGVAGSGKTHFAEVKVAETPPEVNHLGTIVPRALVRIPSEITLMQLLRNILISLGEPIVPIMHTSFALNDVQDNGSELDGLVQRVIDVIDLCVQDYILLDDFHYLSTAGTSKTINSMIETITDIIIESKKCFILLGLPGQMDWLLMSSIRLRLISSEIIFEPFSIDWKSKFRHGKQIEEFDQFVTSVSEITGIQLTNLAKREKLLERIHNATNGVIGDIFNLFIFAEGRAQQLGQSTVDLSILAWAYHNRLEQTRGSTKSTTPKRNPFKDSFDIQSYPVSILEHCQKNDKREEIETGFARWVVPYSDETLVSWVLRILKECRYINLDFFLRFLRYTFDLSYLSSVQLNYDADPHIVKFLSELARISEKHLEEITLKRYWSTLLAGRSRSADSYPQLDLFRSLINDRPRICPICLTETPYIRQVWHFDPYCICEHHEIWMQDSCSSCGTYYEMEDIILGCCVACGNEFSTGNWSYTGITSSQITQQTKLVSWIRLGQHTVGDLRETTLDTVLALVCGLVDSKVKQVENEGRSASPIEFARAYEVALNVVEDTKHAFHIYLDSYRAMQSKDGHYGFEAEFGILYSKWLLNYWISADFKFIHDAFNQYLYSEFLPYDGITNAQWLQIYPDFWDKTDFISVQAVLRQDRSLSMAKLLLAIDSDKIKLYVAPDSYSQFIRKSTLKKLTTAIDHAKH